MRFCASVSRAISCLPWSEYTAELRAALNWATFSSDGSSSETAIIIPKMVDMTARIERTRRTIARRSFFSLRLGVTSAGPATTGGAGGRSGIGL